MGAPNTAWNETPEGSSLNNAFIQFLFTYTNRLPTHLQQLKDLSYRNING